MFDNAEGDVQILHGRLPEPVPLVDPPLALHCNAPLACHPWGLVARIQALEFVEMSELLQEAWIMEAPSTLRLPRRSTPITDIGIWAECFCLMASVLSARFLARSLDLWAYLRRVLSCACKFEGLSWVTYDRSAVPPAGRGSLQPQLGN